MSTFHAVDFERRTTELSGWPVRITSYRLGDTFHCRIDNVSPGALIARAHAQTAKEAMDHAVKVASERLAATRRH